MCGIFGFSGRTYPKDDVMREIAYLAGTRGCHSNGIAWLLPDGSIQTKKYLGKINPDTIFNGVRAKVIIGHCRLSTSGPPTLANAQPLVLHNKAIAHNGTIRQYPTLSLPYKSFLRTKCDSEILLHIPPRKLFTELSQDPYACLMLSNGELTAIRRELPLYELKTDEGTYYCSRQFRNSTLIHNNNG